MFDEQGFEALGAKEVSTGAVDAAPQATPNAPTQPLTFPTTLKEIAVYEGISEASLRNKWFAPKVEPIYQGFECPALRSKNGKYITEFGYQAFKRFYLKVVKGRMDYSAYVADVQADLTPLPSEPKEEQPSAENLPGFTTALARRPSALQRSSFAATSAEKTVRDVENATSEVQQTHELNQLNYINSLRLKHREMGREIGAILFEDEQTGMVEEYTRLRNMTVGKSQPSEATTQ